MSCTNKHRHHHHHCQRDTSKDHIDSDNDDEQRKETKLAFSFTFPEKHVVRGFFPSSALSGCLEPLHMIEIFSKATNI